MRRWIVFLFVVLGVSGLSCEAVAPCSPPCPAGAMCSAGADCLSGVCSLGACNAPRCQDGARNGTETDVDCGGGCAPCGGGAACASGTDCDSGSCDAGRCTASPIDSLSPGLGERAGGTIITVRGARFLSRPPTAIQFDGTPGTGLSIKSDTELVVTTPARDKAGLVDVSVLYGDGAIARKAQAFRYYYGQVEFTAKGHVLQLVGGGCYDLAALDLNADGKDDLAVVCQDRVDTYLSQGDGSFAAASQTPLSAAGLIGQVAVADFNHDKKLDLAITLRTLNKVAILHGKGDGSLDAPMLYGAPGLWEPIALKVADFDHDGYLDVAFADQATPPKVCILRHQEQNKSQYRPAECYLLQGEFPTNITVADLDRNGAQDLVVSSYASNGLMILLYNNYNGLFTKLAGVNVSAATGNVFAGDWNGDGEIDLVAATEKAPPYKQIYFEGDGKGSFKPEVQLGISAQHQAYEAARADFDGNGTEDVVMMGADVNIATVLLSQRGSDASGVMTLPVLSVAPERCFGVTAGDFDGDARVDVVISCGKSGWLNLFMNAAQ